MAVSFLESYASRAQSIRLQTHGAAMQKIGRSKTMGDRIRATIQAVPRGKVPATERSLAPPAIHAQRGKSSKHYIALLDFPGIELSALEARSSFVETPPSSSGSACKPKA